ncbi:MAG: MBL fold metallo-hydrolase [Sandaracinus sp.]
MRTSRLVLLVLAALVAVPVTFLAAFGWPASRHATTTATLGTPSSTDAMEALLDTPGPIEAETIVGADWSVDRSGVLDLEDPRASAFADELEPIQIYVHTMRHPSRGRFLIDTGVEQALVDAPDEAAIHGIVAQAAGVERMQIRTSTHALLARLEAPIEGVLLTHLHLDHVSGLRDVPREVPVYTGPGEAGARSAMALATQGAIDRALEGRDAIREWRFTPDPSGVFAGVLDVFGDGSLFALSVPGHTAGSVAYVARTPEGAVLFTGDVCHTAWGWEHDVAPGTFTEDHDANVASLAALRALAARHPAMRVRLGHQPLP